MYIFWASPQVQPVHPLLRKRARDLLVNANEATHHTFSAFWLRSSVVSVLISLISGTWRMASQVIK